MWITFAKTPQAEIEGGLVGQQSRDLLYVPTGHGLLGSARRGRLSPTPSGWCRAQRYAGRGRTDCRGLKGRITLAEAHCDASDQDSYKQQDRPADPP
jgi:hypothetical protein